jgi:nucleotide-binding universal stress UspA family protein
MAVPCLAGDLGGTLALVRVENDSTTLHQAAQYLAEVKARISARHPGLVVQADVRPGDTAEAIETSVALLDAALVVMATYGRGEVKRAILGSVAGQILQTGEVPLVLFRPEPLPDEENLTPERIPLFVA